MSVKNEYLSPCGMYCSVCSVLAAYQNNDQKLKEKLASVFGTSPENIVCQGCMSGKTFEFVKTYSIRACAQKKRLKGCHQCDDFPCNNIKKFSYRDCQKWDIGSYTSMEGIGHRTLGSRS